MFGALWGSPNVWQGNSDGTKSMHFYSLTNIFCAHTAGRSVSEVHRVIHQFASSFLIICCGFKLKLGLLLAAKTLSYSLFL